MMILHMPLGQIIIFIISILSVVLKIDLCLNLMTIFSMSYLSLLPGVLSVVLQNLMLALIGKIYFKYGGRSGRERCFSFYLTHILNA